MNFDPMAQWGKVFSAWQKLADESISRTTALFGEVEKAEATRVEKTESAIDEIAKLQKESLAYTAKLGAEMRKLSLEAFKNASTMFSSAA